MKFLFFYFLLSCCPFFFFFCAHIFQVFFFFPPFISKSSTPLFLLRLTLHHSFILTWKIFIFSNPHPFAKTVTFRSFSSLEPNCANNSLGQLEPYMVLSLVLDAACFLFHPLIVCNWGWVYKMNRCSNKYFNYFLEISLQEESETRQWFAEKIKAGRKNNWEEFFFFF